MTGSQLKDHGTKHYVSVSVRVNNGYSPNPKPNSRKRPEAACQVSANLRDSMNLLVFVGIATMLNSNTG